MLQLFLMDLMRWSRILSLFNIPKHKPNTWADDLVHEEHAPWRDLAAVMMVRLKTPQQRLCAELEKLLVCAASVHAAPARSSSEFRLWHTRVSMLPETSGDSTATFQADGLDEQAAAFAVRGIVHSLATHVPEAFCVY